MDKIKINFFDSGAEYLYRIPDKIEWFEMSCYSKFNNYDITEYIIYNRGKIFIGKYTIIKNRKVLLKISNEEQELLKKRFIYKFIEYNGLGGLAIYFAQCLNVNIDIKIVENNPYKLLGVDEECSKEKLKEALDTKINILLDAYNSIVKEKTLIYKNKK